MSLFTFSVYNAFRKRAAFLAVIGVALGAALMTILLPLSTGMEKRAENTFSSLANQITISGQDAIFGGLFMGMGTSPIPSSYINAVQTVPHVVKAQPLVSVIMRPKDKSYTIPLFGYNIEQSAGEKYNPCNNLIEGRTPQNDTEIIMGKRLQNYLAIFNDNVQTGDAFVFLDPRKGKTKELNLKITGIYQTGNEVLDGAFSGTESLARQISGIPDSDISAINITVDHIDNVEAAATTIKNLLADKKPGVQVTIPGQVINPVKDILDTLSKFLLVVSLIAAATGGLSILVVMLLSVVYRIREFGILKAMGWTPRNIFFLVLVESLTLSITGALLGVALGWLAIKGTHLYIAGDITILTWQTAARVCLAGAAIGAVGGIYPAWWANRNSPAAILRNN